MPMAFKLRSSKFRHVYGSPFRKEETYENVNITRNTHDSNFCAVNPSYLAVVTESGGGGAFLVLPVERTGRVDLCGPKVTGHAGAVLDIKWNPFNDRMIASCSDDCTVKLWQIPSDGLVVPLTNWWVDLHGHSRRVGYLEWHPTAENIVLSAGFDYKCIVWNVEQAEPVNVVDCHQDTIFSISWNREGSLFATTSKDKKLRTIDPRTGAVACETQCHMGPKASKAVFVDNSWVASAGFSRMSQRQMSLWDLRQSQTPVYTVELDQSCGVILPYYDPDTKVIFLAGKGDGSIKYFEVSTTESRFHFLNVYQSSSPQRGLGVMPKRGCDVKRCEIFRFYKLHAAKNLVEPISMIVPRKSDGFQEDVFPPTASTIPSLQADEWTSGQNREPILVSLLDGGVVSSPPVTTSKAVQKQEGALHHPPTITTYRAVGGRQREPPAKTSGLGRNEVRGSPSRSEAKPAHEPASLKNIKRLSLNEEIVVVPGVPSTSSVNSSVNAEEKRMTPPGAEPSTNGMSASDSESSSSHSVSTQPSVHSSLPGHTFTSSSHWRSGNAPSSRVRRPVTRSQTIASSTQSSHMMMTSGGSSDSSSPNLKKAYFRQLEEIASLKEQLTLKDKRIRQLEMELSTLRMHHPDPAGSQHPAPSVAGGESTC